MPPVLTGPWGTPKPLACFLKQSQGVRVLPLHWNRHVRPLGCMCCVCFVPRAGKGQLDAVSPAFRHVRPPCTCIWHMPCAVPHPARAASVTSPCTFTKCCQDCTYHTLQIMYSYVMNPKTLPASYWNFHSAVSNCMTWPACNEAVQVRTPLRL